jgi:hypothetical protein
MTANTDSTPDPLVTADILAAFQGKSLSRDAIYAALRQHDTGEINVALRWMTTVEWLSDNNDVFAIANFWASKIEAQIHYAKKTNPELVGYIVRQAFKEET